MVKDLSLCGIKYDGAACAVLEIITRMIDMANQEHAFVYADVNGTPLMIDPGMSIDDGLELLKKIRSKEIKIIFYDSIIDYSAKDIAKSMAKLSKQNDFVISDINGTVFRITNNMTTTQVLHTLAKVRLSGYNPSEIIPNNKTNDSR